MTGPMTALNLAFVNCFRFKGRATRAEFWWVVLIFSAIGMVAVVADVLMMSKITSTGDQAALLALGPFDFYSTVYSLVTAIPFLTLSVRRLHDVGMSGFWWLLNLIPGVGAIILIVIYCLPSDNNTSVHGTPKGLTAGRSSKPVTVDAHKRAMQGYATLFDKDKKVTPETVAARKAEVADYYRNHVLKSAPGA